MASELLVRVCKISRIDTISGAKTLELAIIGGWQSAVQMGKFKAGDLIVYVPPDAILPVELSDRLNVTKYLDKQRVRTIKLMKGTVVSMGLVIANEGNWTEGVDVKAHYNITKYIPPANSVHTISSGGGNPKSIKNHPLFHKYSSPQNLRYYPEVFTPDELVVVTEKIHGSNIRTGLINGKWMSGSHEVQRLMPLQYQLEAYKGFKYIKLLITSTIARIYGYIHAKIGNLCHRAYVCLPPAIGAFKPIALAYKHIRKLWRKIGAGKHVAAFQESNIYWTPYTIPEVRKLLENLASMHGNDQVIIYGELYGPGIQKLTYGVDKLSFRAFDIMINGKYIDYSRFLAYCQMYGVPTCTELYYGPYKNIDNIKTFADGNTTLPNASHIREGVVVKAATEDTHPDVGRKILKYISNAYLAWKDGREDLDSTDI